MMTDAQTASIYTRGPCAGGLFMYLREEQVRSLVLELAEVFPGSELVCEVAGRFAADMMRTRWAVRHLHKPPGGSRHRCSHGDARKAQDPA